MLPRFGAEVEKRQTTSHYWFDRALLLFSFAEKNFNYFIFRCGSLVPVVVVWYEYG